MTQGLALATVILSGASAQPEMTAPRHFLALGDSYTIGEGVESGSSWPVLLAQLMGKTAPMEPQVIAQTGWTTDELAEALSSAAKERRLRACYDLVSLSVGVNNQYRGRPVATFASDFEALLNRAVALAGGAPQRVLVLSIPDWGHSPFAQARGVDRPRIASQINAYNERKRQLTRARGAQWIDVTPDSRKAGPEAFAADGLHPGETAHAQWAQLASGAARNALQLKTPCPPPS